MPSETIATVVPEELATALRDRAALERRSLSQLVAIWLADRLKIEKLGDTVQHATSFPVAEPEAGE